MISDTINENVHLNGSHHTDTLTLKEWSILSYFLSQGYFQDNEAQKIYDESPDLAKTLIMFCFFLLNKRLHLLIGFIIWLKLVADITRALIG